MCIGVLGSGSSSGGSGNWNGLAEARVGMPVVVIGAEVGGRFLHLISCIYCMVRSDGCDSAFQLISGG